MDKPKQKTRSQKKIVPIKKLEPEKRIHNFKEVSLGYSKEEAIEEAERCMQCVKPQCIEGCPVNVDIPIFIKLIKQKKFYAAIKKIKEKNVLPAICGRVCPQEEQCQKFCILTKLGKQINIGQLERFAANWKENEDDLWNPKKIRTTGKKVAVIGSGPAGLTVSSELAKLGHEVTIYEALHTPGGVLTYGIPEFRLPRKIVIKEIDNIKKIGVKIRTNYLVGRTGTIRNFLSKGGYNAVFIGSGAGLPLLLNLPGENLGGIYYANEFLIRINLMKAYNFPKYDTPIRIGKKVTVIGSGNVAIDSARSSLRLGAKHVYIVYRRSRNEVPARFEELENAEEEGIKFIFLTSPIRFIDNKNGWIKAMECIHMKLGAPDKTGRRRPIPIKNSEFIIDTDTVIVAIGSTPNPIIQNTTKGLKVTKKGTIVVNERGETNIKGVYAGGDIVTGEATVINAMGTGKKVANSINEYLTK